MRRSTNFGEALHKALLARPHSTIESPGRRLGGRVGVRTYAAQTSAAIDSPVSAALLSASATAARIPRAVCIPSTPVTSTAPATSSPPVATKSHAASRPGPTCDRSSDAQAFVASADCGPPSRSSIFS